MYVHVMMKYEIVAIHHVSTLIHSYPYSCTSKYISLLSIAPDSDSERPVMLMNLNKFLARRPSKVDMFKSGILVGNTVRGEKTNVEPAKRVSIRWDDGGIDF